MDEAGVFYCSADNYQTFIGRKPILVVLSPDVLALKTLDEPHLQLIYL